MKNQTKITTDLLAAGVKPEGEWPENIVLAISPVRTASTLLNRIAAINNISSFYQHIKARLRWLTEDQPQDKPVTIPNVNTILMKETFGPYSEAEITYDPLAVLLQAGVPKDRIKLIVSYRDPILTAVSWLEQFGKNGVSKEELLKNLVQAYETMDKIETKATELGIKVVPIHYDALRDEASPFALYQEAFSKVGVAVSHKNFAVDWTTLPRVEDPTSGVAIPDEPERYKYSVKHPIFDTLNESTGVRYVTSPYDKIDRVLGEDGIRILENSRVFEIFERNRRACEVEFGREIRPSTQLRDYRIRHPRVEGSLGLRRAAKR